MLAFAQAMFKLTVLIESSIVGSTPTRSADLAFKTCGPATAFETAKEARCYNKTNNRATMRELMKYALAGRRVFEALPLLLPPRP